MGSLFRIVMALKRMRNRQGKSMNTVWVVTQGERDCSDGYTWAVAAFTSKEAAKGFEIDHQLWLDRMEIDKYVDCYQIPLDPEYTANGYVLVKTSKADGSLTSIPLEHVAAKWMYRGQPNEMYHEKDHSWVIVAAPDQTTAQIKASALFNKDNQNT